MAKDKKKKKKAIKSKKAKQGQSKAFVKNLKPIRTTKRAKELGRKGGLVKSPKKRYMNQLNALKKKGLANQRIQKIIDIMEDRKSSTLDIRLYLDAIKGMIQKKEIKKENVIPLANALMTWHSKHHGDINRLLIDKRELSVSLHYDMTKPLTKEEEEELTILFKEARKRE